MAKAKTKTTPKSAEGLTTPPAQINAKAVSDLRPAGYNPRNISPEKLAMLKKAMEEYGDLGGVIFNTQTGRLIGGHQRTKNLDPTWPIHKEPHTDAAGTVAIGYIETPNGRWTYREVEWAEKKEKAANIAANKMGGDWDDDLLQQLLSELYQGGLDMDLTGFDQAELDELLGLNKPKQMGEEDPDTQPAEDPFVNLGDLWLCGDHRLCCGDSTSVSDVDKLMRGEKASLVWTDPPYNVDYASKNASLNKTGKGNSIQTPIENDSFKTDDLFREFLESAFSMMAYALKPGGVFYIACPVGMQETTFRIAIRATAGLKHAQCLIWVKNNHVLGRSDFNGKHEPIQYGWKEGAGHYFNCDFSQTTVIDEDIDITKLGKAELMKVVKELREREPTTVIRIDKPMKSDIHPTQKPVRLVERCVIASSQHGDIVLDLFNSGGSSMIACEKMGRKYRGMELTPAYTQATLTRYFTYCGKEPLLLNFDGSTTPFSEVEKQRKTSK